MEPQSRAGRIQPDAERVVPVGLVSGSGETPLRLVHSTPRRPGGLSPVRALRPAPQLSQASLEGSSRPAVSADQGSVIDGDGGNRLRGAEDITHRCTNTQPRQNNSQFSNVNKLCYIVRGASRGALAVTPSGRGASRWARGQTVRQCVSESDWRPGRPIPLKDNP